jgi:O-antigen ligase
MNIRISSIINIIIFFSFLGHFGINLLGQDVYYFYIFEIFLLMALFIKNGVRIDISSFENKLFLYFFLLCVISGLVSVTADVPDFKNQSILTSSLKGLIYLSLNIFMILILVTYGNNEEFFKNLLKLFKYIILFTLIYAALEVYHDYYSKNNIIKFILNIFHTSSRSINKDFLNLLGHEHSNSSIFVLILYSFMISNLLNQKKVFRYYFIDIAIIIALIVSLALLESKLGYVIFGVLNFFVFITIAFNLKLNFKHILSLLVLFLIVFFLYQVFFYKVEKAMGLIFNYDHPSFNIRANFALASLYLMYQYPIIGVGINNFKFYLLEAIEGLEKIQWLNIRTEGDIDGYSTLELNSYLYGSAGVPDPANMILGIGAEIGILALIIFILILIIIFIKGFKLTQNNMITKEERIMAQFLFFSFIIVSVSFLGFYQLYLIIQWIILGLNVSFFSFIYNKYYKV